MCQLCLKNRFNKKVINIKTMTGSLVRTDYRRLPCQQSLNLYPYKLYILCVVADLKALSITCTLRVRYVYIHVRCDIMCTLCACCGF